MGFDVALPAADPPHRRQPPQGAQQHPRRRPRRPRQPVGHRQRRGRPHRHRARAWARSTTSTTWSQAARDAGMEIALDYALQCSPDHPWVKEHPEWFHHRPDGSIKYAENPPKKYQDIYPINFWPDGRGRARRALWQACKDILDFWIGHGVRIFRVDNPHTKPLAFWEWVIPAVQRDHPDVLFLAEAFTRPKVMATLAEVGLHPELHLLHLAHRPSGSCATTWRRSPRGPRPTTCGPTSGPTRPTSSPAPCATAARPRSSSAWCWPPPWCRPTASTAATSCARTRPRRRPTRSTSTPRSTRSSTATGTTPTRWPRSSPSSTTSAAATRPSPSWATSASTARSTSSMLAYSKRSADGSDTVLVVVNLDPLNRPRRHAWCSTSTPWACPPTGPSPPTTSSAARSTPGRGPSAYVRLDPWAAAHVFSLRHRSRRTCDRRR